MKQQKLILKILLSTEQNHSLPLLHPEELELISIKPLGLEAEST